MQAIMRLHLLSAGLHRRNWRRASRLVDGTIRLVFGAVVPGGARIDRSVVFEHSGLGVVLNELAEIGPRCRIGVHVVVGGRAPIIGAATIGEGTVIHAGARLIGPITIGADCVIAANAVVIADLPSGVMAAGVPATIRKRASPAVGST